MARRRHRSDDDRWRALAAMTAAESIRVGEALWASDLMRVAVPGPAPRPPSLAVSLKLRGSRR
jgi:hypothetical protein